jgi:hypothetical protein
MYRKNKHISGVVKDRMWIRHNIIGTHRTSPNCLSQKCECTTVSSTMFIWMFIWIGIIKEGWLQSDTGWTLTISWVSQYHIPRSIWMSWHTYHAHTRMPERLTFNQNIIFYLSYLYNLWHEIKKMYIQIFHLVRNTTTTIGWLTTSGHIWFDKPELR